MLRKEKDHRNLRKDTEIKESQGRKNELKKSQKFKEGPQEGL